MGGSVSSHLGFEMDTFGLYDYLRALLRPAAVPLGNSAPQPPASPLLGEAVMGVLPSLPWYHSVLPCWRVVVLCLFRGRWAIAPLFFLVWVHTHGSAAFRHGLCRLSDVLSPRSPIWRQQTLAGSLKVAACVLGNHYVCCSRVIWSHRRLFPRCIRSLRVGAASAPWSLCCSF